MKNEPNVLSNKSFCFAYLHKIACIRCVLYWYATLSFLMLFQPVMFGRFIIKSSKNNETSIK